MTIPLQIKIRPAQLEDASAIAQLIEQMGGHEGAATSGAISQLLPDLLASDSWRGLVAATEHGAVIGFGDVHCRRSLANGSIQGWVSVLAVHPAWRGQGAGAAILRGLDVEAGRLGCTELVLESSLSRDDAHRFYLREGFGDLPAAKRFRRPLSAASAGERPR